MANSSHCSVCDEALRRNLEISHKHTNIYWAAVLGVSEASLRRHYKHVDAGEPVRRPGLVAGFKTNTAKTKEQEAGLQTSEEATDGSRAVTERLNRKVTMEDARKWLRDSGDDPDDFNIAIKSIEYGKDLYSNKMSAWPKFSRTGSGAPEVPEWTPIHQADPVVVVLPELGLDFTRINGYKIALKCSDTQIGFRHLPDGSLDPFHDDRAMNLFVLLCHAYGPDKITILGDFLDLPAQGRFDQEAAFANTTQLAINRGHTFLSQLREASPKAEITLIEDNHDLRMKRFIENNTLATFGMKRDNLPESWPVMSLPYLLRLDELGVRYVDAYPAATDWDNDLTRNIHGTKANSKGSTMAQYIHELPHVNTWAGHTHRAEVVYRTVLGARGEAIESYAANPGVLCRVDGAVPSVHGATDSSGIPAHVVEDWQQGFGILYYNEKESWPQVYRIRDGATIVEGRRFNVLG